MLQRAVLAKGEKDNSLVMWNFEEVNKPQEITYKIKGVLTEECLKQIESMGIADKLGIDINGFFEKEV